MIILDVVLLGWDDIELGQWQSYVSTPPIRLPFSSASKASLPNGSLSRTAPTLGMPKSFSRLYGG
jgi:hypothetical protein